MKENIYWANWNFSAWPRAETACDISMRVDVKVSGTVFLAKDEEMSAVEGERPLKLSIVWFSFSACLLSAMLCFSINYIDSWAPFNELHFAKR